MSAIQIATKILKADADVKAVVNNRIFPIQALQKVEGTYLVVNIISAQDTSLINVPGEYYRDRIAVDVNGTSADAVLDLGDIIRLKLPRVIKQTIGIFTDVDIMFADVDFTQPNDMRNAFLRTLQFFVRWRT
jgi:hypothetical protein